jgi:hypothetical protein
MSSLVLRRERCIVLDRRIRNSNIVMAQTVELPRDIFSRSGSGAVASIARAPQFDHFHTQCPLDQGSHGGSPVDRPGGQR